MHILEPGGVLVVEVGEGAAAQLGGAFQIGAAEFIEGVQPGFTPFIEAFGGGGVGGVAKT